MGTSQAGRLAGCLCPVITVRSKHKLRSEILLWVLLRTGVRLPSPPPLKTPAIYIDCGLFYRVGYTQKYTFYFWIADRLCILVHDYKLYMHTKRSGQPAPYFYIIFACLIRACFVSLCCVILRSSRRAAGCPLSRVGGGANDYIRRTVPVLSCVNRHCGADFSQ